MLQEGNKVLLTGGTGFLGKIIYEELFALGKKVTRLGRSEGNELAYDLAAEVPVITSQFDLVVHTAGKAHVVPESEEEKEAFYTVNVRGTENLLKGFEQSRLLPSAIVFISTVAVYGLSYGENIIESQPLMAQDPYGKSKIEAEQLLEKWCSERNVKLIIFRLPLIGGPNPPGNLHAMINGLKKGRYLRIAGGVARKSIVMASDVASIIPEAVNHPGTYHLTDGHHPAFHELEDMMIKQLQVKPPLNVPKGLASLLGMAGDVIDKISPGRSPVTSRKIEKIISTLTFDDQKARTVLGWNPNRVIDVFRIE